MKTISALYVVHNEQELIKGSIERILPYVNEVIVVLHGCTDQTAEEIAMVHSNKIKIFAHGYHEPVDMGAVRTFSLKEATGDWVWQIDADEYYPEESCKEIVNRVNSANKEISFRVPYFNVAWRYGYAEKGLEHYPDRLYRRDVVDKYEGILPNDMTHVKPEHYQHRPFLEYDNAEDKSFENPVQPIIQAPFYHLARSRGYNYEFNKWVKYNIRDKGDALENAKKLARINQWVTGLYPTTKMELDVPKRTMPKPKVSVIIPNFQHAEFVGLAIQSVLDQYQPAHEIIVVDDGSMDNSRKIIKHYPVKLIEQANQGVAAARNTGIVNSTGDYFICLDADDELAPDFIEKTLKMMQGDVQVVFTDLQFIGAQDGVVGYPDFVHKNLLEFQCLPSACALIDRRVFEAVGGFDTSELFEDWGFWLRIAKNGFNFAQVKEPLFRYRKHGVSRIDFLDSQMTAGYNQLRERYGITRKPDKSREADCVKLAKQYNGK
jgi:glycosyltransferase involved in cell wall biosynthesis